MKLRGFLTVASVGVLFVTSDLVQRLVIGPLTWVAPARKERMLAGWSRGLAHTVLALLRTVGGARFEPFPAIPSFEGVLVLMNHQSLVDIPIVWLTLERGYPRILTRARYRRGVPLVSHMLRLYEHPVVDPRSGLKGQLEVLRAVARDPRVPLVVFPEGSRSRDGALLPFRRGAVDSLLRQRQWKVYLATADGTLACGRLKDMLNGVDSVHCRVSVAGPFDTPTDPDEFPAWLEDMESRMHDSLAALRSNAAAPVAGPATSEAEPAASEEPESGSKPEPEPEPEPDGTERVG